MTSPAPEPLATVIEDAVGNVLSSAVASNPVFVDLLDIGKLLLEDAPAIIAMIEARRAGMTSQQLADSIKASMVLASDAAVTAELGPRP